MIYYDYHRLSTVEEFALGARYANLDQLVEQSDIITINTPLTPETDGMFNRGLLFHMKKGAYLINTARGRIVDTLSLVEALEKGHLAGYAGDVWFPQPAAKGPSMAAYAKSCNGSALLRYNFGSTKEIRGRK